MTGLEKLIEWLQTSISMEDCIGDTRRELVNHIINEARSILDEEAQKPTANADLVGDGYGGLYSALCVLDAAIGIELDVHRKKRFGKHGRISLAAIEGMSHEILKKFHPVPAPKEVKWCEWAVIRRDWYGARKIGKVLGDTIECSQEWTPILWEGTEDPDFHKTVGLVFFTTREDAVQYAKGWSNADEPCKKCSGKGLVQIAPNTRGMTTCPICNGKGKIGGNKV